MEAVGDAFLVVAGVPDPLMSHAQRAANTALAMCMVARRIASPYDYGDGTTAVKVITVLLCILYQYN